MRCGRGLGLGGRPGHARLFIARSAKGTVLLACLMHRLARPRSLSIAGLRASECPIRAGRWATRPGRASVSRLCRHCRGRYRCQHSVRLNAPGLDAACLPASLYPVIVALMTADYESRLPIRDGTADACIARNDSTVLCLLFRLSKRMHASRSRRMQQLMHPADC